MSIIKRFDLYLESLSEHELHYFSFDWDDNILHMPTVIHMDKMENGDWKPIDVSTSEFAKVRNDSQYRIVNGDPVAAFSEFRDTGKRGNMAFLIDTKKALSDGKFGPSWESFIECLKSGSIFSIITARGHEPQTIRRAVEFIIEEYLTEDDQFEMYSNCIKHSYIFGDKDFEYERVPKTKITDSKLIQDYLDLCDFYGVTSDFFASEFGSASASNPEKAKEMALNKFVDKCNQLGQKVGAKTVSVGFSDDDLKNVEHVHKFFKQKSALSPGHKVKYNVYDTNDRTIKGGKRTVYTSESNQSHGMESSIMPFTQYNNMASRLFPASDELDPVTNTHRRAVNHLHKTNKDIFRKRKRKKSQ